MAFAGEQTKFQPYGRRVLRAPIFWAVLGLWLLLVLIEVVRPCFFLHDDNATWVCGAYLHDYRVLTETGRLAEVNYYQYGGEPFLEQGQTAVLYPPIYAGVALAQWISGDPRCVNEWLAGVHLTLGLIGFYFWLRQGRVEAVLAALGALAWVFNPFTMIVSASWIIIAFITAWLPWFFWALDRLIEQPGLRTAFLLGTILGLFFLQGHVQLVFYSMMFAAFYVAIQFPKRHHANRMTLVYYLLLSSLVFFILTLPLILPMIHATAFSTLRAKPLPTQQALFFHIKLWDLVRAQFFLFRSHLVFDANTAILFCPALLLLPFITFKSWISGGEKRRRLFALVVVTLLALIFAGKYNYLLSWLPLFNKFRWPFKFFLFVQFFLLAASVLSLASKSKKNLARACLALVLGTHLAVSLCYHDSNFFSQASLPAVANPLPNDMNTDLGRVVAFVTTRDNILNYRFYTACYGTYYQVPSLGGYNPLVGHEQIRFGAGIDFPNVFYQSITPEVREILNARSARYWIIEPHSSQLRDIARMDGLNLLESEEDRIVLENTQALPLVYSAYDPAKPCKMTYSGNSILIPLDRVTSPVEISVGPTDGWWYRIDHGPWQQSDYLDDHLQVAFPSSAHLLEVSYFDARFRTGLYLSVLLLFVLGFLLLIRVLQKRQK